MHYFSPFSVIPLLHTFLYVAIFSKCKFSHWVIQILFNFIRHMKSLVDESMGAQKYVAHTLNAIEELNKKQRTNLMCTSQHYKCTITNNFFLIKCQQLQQWKLCRICVYIILCLFLSFVIRCPITIFEFPNTHTHHTSMHTTAIATVTVMMTTVIVCANIIRCIHLHNYNIYSRLWNSSANTMARFLELTKTRLDNKMHHNLFIYICMHNTMKRVNCVVRLHNIIHLTIYKYSYFVQTTFALDLLNSLLRLIVCYFLCSSPKKQFCVLQSKSILHTNIVLMIINMLNSWVKFEEKKTM